MPEIRLELIDELLKGYEKPEDITGEGGLLKQLTKAVLERALESEMTHELGYEKHSVEGRNGAIRGMARAGRSCRQITARWRLSYRETGKENSSLGL